MLHLLAIAWTPFSTPLVGRHHTYHIDDTFCNAIHFREDPLFTWRRFGCDAVHAIVRESFDVWQHNTPLSFTETSNASAATVLLSTSSNLDAGVLGVARRRIAFGSEDDTSATLNASKRRHACSMRVAPFLPVQTSRLDG